MKYETRNLRKFHDECDKGNRLTEFQNTLVQTTCRARRSHAVSITNVSARVFNEFPPRKSTWSNKE